ncbi:MAG: TonB-dependent receptor [Woeseiaceae bacterium]
MRHLNANFLRGEYLAVAVLALLISGPQASAQDTRQIEEITVTATKRAESVQDVPVSIGVVTGEFMQTFDVKDMSDLQSFVPGLQVQQTFGSWAVRVRGLGSGITNLAFDSSVPIYIDDVYCGRGKCLESAFLDVERVEVARGPQGALFGKSTIAGAIGAVTAGPTEEFDAQIKVGAETEYGGFTSSAHISGALSDTVRARFALKHEDLDGYTDNTWLGQEDGNKEVTAARLSFEFDVGDASLVSLKLENGTSETNGRNNQTIGANPNHEAVSGDPSPEYNPDDIRRVSTGVEKEDFYDYDWTSATLALDTEFGGHSFKAIAAYWEYDSEWFLDVDGFPARILNTTLNDEYDQTTLELRLLSPTDQRFEYIAGIWYQQSDLTTIQFSDFTRDFWLGALPPFLHGLVHPTNPVGMSRNFSRDTDAYSVYGQLTWNISDRLRAFLDLRYTDETQDGVGNGFPLLYEIDTFFDPTRTNGGFFGQNREYLFFEERDDDSFDPSLRVQYDLNDSTMIYGVYAEGSKAGGMKANDANLGDQLWLRAGDTEYLQQYLGVSTITEADIAAGLTFEQGNGIFDFEDEEAESWELGMKTSLGGGVANLNVAIFTTEFTNLQTSNYNGTAFIIGNAGQATVDGAEVELTWQATDNLRIASSLAWINAEYDDWEGAQCVVDANGQPKNSDCVGAGTGATENQAGEPLERSPDLEFNLSAMWESQISTNLLLKAAASYYYSDEYFVQPTQAVFSTQDYFAKYDIRVALADIDDRWEVGINGRNLGDEMTIQHAYNIAGNQFNNLSQGRSVTIEGTYRF